MNQSLQSRLESLPPFLHLPLTRQLSGFVCVPDDRIIHLFLRKGLNVQMKHRNLSVLSLGTWSQTSSNHRKTNTRLLQFLQSQQFVYHCIDKSQDQFAIQAFTCTCGEQVTSNIARCLQLGTFLSSLIRPGIPPSQ